MNVGSNTEHSTGNASVTPAGNPVLENTGGEEQLNETGGFITTGSIFFLALYSFQLWLQTGRQLQKSDTMKFYYNHVAFIAILRIRKKSMNTTFPLHNKY